jgi:predicted nucleotidyltransferase
MRPEKKHREPGKNTAIPARWHKAIFERAAEREKLRISILEQIDTALTTLEKKYHWDDMYLFGSVAQKGKFSRNSDIDIAISGLNKLEHYAFTGEISELLDKPVDVVLLEECIFAQSIKEKGLKWNRETGF